MNEEVRDILLGIEVDSVISRVQTEVSPNIN